MPSARLAGGHRLYDADDVARLYRIIRLRPLGFPLSQVAEVLAEPEWQLAPAIERHPSLYVQSAAFRRYAGCATAMSTGASPAGRRPIGRAGRRGWRAGTGRRRVWWFRLARWRAARQGDRRWPGSAAASRLLKARHRAAR